MDCAHMNHYEKQLYTVFKTFDVDNEEALEKAAVLELCDALQLEDRGATLIESLFERHSGRVTFTQFRNGLLSVLGGDESAPLPTAATISQPLHSDDETSGREVAPKFVFGAKKYGRRSRPQHVVTEEAPRPRVSSDSRLEGERFRERMRCKRSASVMENRVPLSDADVNNVATQDLDCDRRVDREHALSLCRGLQMTSIDTRLVDGVFESTPTGEITVGDFFDRLNTTLTTSIATSLDGAGTASQIILPSSERRNELEDELPSDTIVEAFERCGVRRPRRLLLELGFTAASVRPLDLERALDEELQALTASTDGRADARDFLSLALLTLMRLRLERAQQSKSIAVAERDKLRVDLAEANRRARLLAQDVDENHARIEAELKLSLRQVEIRHNEAARLASDEMSREREKTAATLSRLEEEIARRSDVELRLRAEVLNLRDRVKNLELRATNAEEKAQHAERERARLAADMKVADEASALAAEASRVTNLQLEASLEELRLENKSLRDRNDELCAELEVAPQTAATPTTVCPDISVSWRDEAPLETSLSLNDSCNKRISFVTNQNAQSAIVKTLQETVARIRVLSSSGDGRCESCSAIAHSIASVEAGMLDVGEYSTMLADAQVQTDVCHSSQTNGPKDELEIVKQTYTKEKTQLMAVISELESSYEQLKMEYDKCEEYWSGKLEEERDILNEEQRVGDERLAELVAKIGDYERQFARAPLPTIEERDVLEQQVTALEEEFAIYRRDKEAQLAARSDELAIVKKRLEELERHAPARGARDGRPAVATAPHHAPSLTSSCAPCPKCGACDACAACGTSVRSAAALRARAARAERAAQRLAARLAAADLLVKDLYLENCRLAHRPRMP